MDAGMDQLRDDIMRWGDDFQALIHDNPIDDDITDGQPELSMEWFLNTANGVFEIDEIGAHQNSNHSRQDSSNVVYLSSSMQCFGVAQLQHWQTAIGHVRSVSLPSQSIVEPQTQIDLIPRWMWQGLIVGAVLLGLISIGKALLPMMFSAFPMILSLPLLVRRTALATVPILRSISWISSQSIGFALSVPSVFSTVPGAVSRVPPSTIRGLLQSRQVFNLRPRFIRFGGAVTSRRLLATAMLSCLLY